MFLKLFDRSAIFVGNTMKNFSRFIPDANNCISSKNLCMSHHNVKCLFPGFLTELGQNRNITSDDCLKADTSKIKFQPAKIKPKMDGILNGREH